MAWWTWRKAKLERADRRIDLTQAGPIYSDIADALDDLYKTAANYRARPDSFWDRAAGCNVGDHLAHAAQMMEAQLARVPDGPPESFLPAIALALDASRAAYCETYHDPDCFGIGAHNSLLRKVLEICDCLGIARPHIEPFELADDMDDT
ncbi:hypothetical protein [Armatimonas sp.]|uniref:hypothetical protein n=1 Tax=Armatimonas sp. TaxID=1872638 RepID=UPI0037538239